MTREAWVFAIAFAVALVLLAIAQNTNRQLAKENRQLLRARMAARAPRAARGDAVLPEQRKAGES